MKAQDQKPGEFQLTAIGFCEGKCSYLMRVRKKGVSEDV